MKRLFLSLCAILMCSSLLAQEHLFEVKRLNNWGKEYLTVVNDYCYVDYDNKKKYESNSSHREIIEGFDIFHGLVILEINGQSTKNMSEQEFYNILDNSPEKVELKTWWLPDEEPENVVMKNKIVLPESVNKKYIQVALHDALNEIYHVTAQDTYWNYYKYEYKSIISERKSKFEKNGVKCNELIDPDFDWFYVRTYDFAIVGDDPLVDRAILEKLNIPGRWKRDTENPDVIFMISKDSHESISSTYVPPTVRTINHGSQTKARYNALTNATEYTTTQNNQTIREGGYTQTTSTTDLFLEISLLDAKRINDPNQQAAPIIWQATYSTHATNVNLNVVDVYKAWATWAFMYDYDARNKFSATAYTFERAWACNEDYVVTYAAPYSSLKVGDKILKFKLYNKKSKWSNKFGLNVIDSEEGENSVYSRWWGDKNRREYCDTLYAVCIERGGQKMTLKIVPFLKNTGYIQVYCWKEFNPE